MVGATNPPDRNMDAARDLKWTDYGKLAVYVNYLIAIALRHGRISVRQPDTSLRQR